ncbi:MAG: LVIVD repeat-containing protein [Candidatus Halalkalibacterium sp. M3_1C_030]
MKKSTTVLITALLLLVFQSYVFAQDTESQKQIAVEPSPIELNLGEELQLKAKVLNTEGEEIQDEVIFYSRSRRSVSVTTEGLAKALKPGKFELVVRTVGPRSERISKTVMVNVPFPPIQEIAFVDKPVKIYSNTTIPVSYKVIDSHNLVREDASVKLKSSNNDIARIDEFGQLKALKPGTTTLTAKAENASAIWEIKVSENPVSSILIDNNVTSLRTGDVVDFNAVAKTSSGKVIDEMPVTYSFVSKTDDDLGEGASGQIEQDGRFVANKTGLFTVFAKAGNTVTEKTIRVNERDVQKELQVVGHGLINDVHTSDLWIWEGVDGRDYAVTGTWGGNGEAYFWDVTDPSQMTIIDTVRVDARTVNDVKVSEDGRTAVITREGASDRKNGIVILDVTNPRDVKIISEYNEGLTGGVHNAFIYKNHVFAVNNGRRYDIIDITDPKNPQTVSRFELDTPGHSIHDVWVENGIAYSSNWSDGIVAVDVGSTPMADSPEKHNVGVGSFENPVKLGSYSYPSGWNHAAFPFKSKSTGDFYVIAGDEAFPNGLGIDNEPTIPAGWIHFVKFEGGWDSPKEVARYQVPEAGTHNMWVKGDTLYVAYYNAGLRIVDISGELMGDLYDQGREIAKHIPTHHEGRVPNAPMAWGPQPYKGYIFVSDWNSGLWAYKLVEKPRGTN